MGVTVTAADCAPASPVGARTGLVDLSACCSVCCAARSGVDCVTVVGGPLVDPLLSSVSKIVTTGRTTVNSENTSRPRERLPRKYMPKGPERLFLALSRRRPPTTDVVPAGIRRKELVFCCDVDG